MRAEIATLLTTFSPTPGVSLLRLSAPMLAPTIQPGQYLMARLASGWDPFFREPLFVASIQPADQIVTLWVPHGTATRERLSALPPGSPLDLFGTFGRPLIRRSTVRNLLLIAEGLAVGPLLALAEAGVAAGQQVALLDVIPGAGEPYPAEALPVDVEYQRAPRGGAGAVARELLRWADTVFAAGSQKFYNDLRDEIREARPGQRGGFAFGLLLEPFGWQPPQWGAGQVVCAAGACRCCQVELRREKRLACVEGPAFDLWTLG